MLDLSRQYASIREEVLGLDCPRGDSQPLYSGA